MKVRGSRWPHASGPRFKSKKYIEKYSEIFSFRTTCLRCLKFGMKRCLMALYHVCLNEGPRVQEGPAPGGPGFNHRNT